MDNLFCKKIQFVCVFFNWVQDLKKIEKFGLEFLILLCLDVFAIQPNLLSLSIALRLHAFIMCFFLEFKGVEQVLLTNIHSFFQFFCQFVGKARSRAKVNIVFEGNSQIEAAVDFKRRVVGASILGIVVCKLSYWQKACLVILLLVYKSFEVCLHCAILSLSLPIGLRIESRKKFFLES